LILSNLKVLMQEKWVSKNIYMASSLKWLIQDGRQNGLEKLTFYQDISASNCDLN